MLTAPLSQTFLYGTSSYRIEPTFEDETDDIEIFLESADTTGKAERLPQLAMSLFRKPELGNPHYRNSSSEDEDDEYYELGSSPEPEDVDQESYDALHPDIVRLRDSMAQQEAEKHEKSYAAPLSLFAVALSSFFFFLCWRPPPPLRRPRSHRRGAWLAESPCS